MGHCVAVRDEGEDFLEDLDAIPWESTPRLRGGLTAWCLCETMTLVPGRAIDVGPEFYATQAAWYAGIAAMARAGVGIIMDEVFLDGEGSQDNLRKALAGLRVAWVGVRCDADVAEARERDRGDRTPGLARDQATRVHAGTAYDLIVDTTRSSPSQCAQAVIERLSL